MDSGFTRDLAGFQERIGVRFADLGLLERAMVHRSYLNEHPNEQLESNERLEFLGDAVLGFIVADLAYARFPDFPEGTLTRLRIALVREEALATLARQIQLGALLRMGKGEAANGGRNRNSILADAFEAVIGAIYLDQGLDAVRGFAIPLMLTSLDETAEIASAKDAKSLLQEWSQRVSGITPVYRVISETGPDHLRTYVVEVLIGDEVRGVGEALSKQSAEMAAARAAWATVPRE